MEPLQCDGNHLVHAVCFTHQHVIMSQTRKAYVIRLPNEKASKEYKIEVRKLHQSTAGGPQSIILYGFTLLLYYIFYGFLFSLRLEHLVLLLKIF